jgi:hypothetical protein
VSAYRKNARPLRPACYRCKGTGGRRIWPGHFPPAVVLCCACGGAGELPTWGERHPVAARLVGELTLCATRAFVAACELGARVEKGLGL